MQPGDETIAGKYKLTLMEIKTEMEPQKEVLKAVFSVMKKDQLPDKENITIIHDSLTGLGYHSHQLTAQEGTPKIEVHFGDAKEAEKFAMVTSLSRDAFGEFSIMPGPKDTNEIRLRPTNIEKIKQGNMVTVYKMARKRISQLFQQFGYSIKQVRTDTSTMPPIIVVEPAEPEAKMWFTQVFAQARTLQSLFLFVNKLPANAFEIGPKKYGYILAPSYSFFEKFPDPVADIDIDVGLIEDIHVVLAGFNPQVSEVRIQVSLNPLMLYLWVGAALMIIGALVSALFDRRKTLAEYGKEKEA
jgi:hypothetical protein